MTNQPVITAHGLSVHFPIGGGLFRRRQMLRAVDNVDIEIPRGSFFGLVGESGSGKTTLGRAFLKAAPITTGDAINGTCRSYVHSTCVFVTSPRPSTRIEVKVARGYPEQTKTRPLAYTGAGTTACPSPR